MLFRMLGACGSPPAPAHRSSPPAAVPGAVRRDRSGAAAGLSGSDGCVETELPWKSSSLSGSAVTAPTVGRAGRLRFGVPIGSDAAGSVPGVGGGGCVVLCRLKLGASLFQARLNHLGSGTRSHALAGPAGQGLLPVMGQKELEWAGGPPLPCGW